MEACKQTELQKEAIYKEKAQGRLYSFLNLIKYEKADTIANHFASGKFETKSEIESVNHLFAQE